ncbi:hypothetical protein PTKIN_Ptkin07bG0056400 [Pterospermum kingtungense]
MIRCHIPTLSYYEPNGGSNFFDPRKLKEALSNILVPFYPKLEVMDQFIGDFTHNSQVSTLVPKVDYSGGISSYPLLVLQVTAFKCGGVCVGVGLHHTLADGTSALHFINSWADTTRGFSPRVAPFMDRTLLRARVPPTPTFHRVEYDPSPPMNITTSHSDQSQSDNLRPSSVSIFKLTADQLNILKAKSNIENADDTMKYSTYNVITAHLWRCISKARGLSNDQATKLYISIDGQSRLKPPLPPGYFGNVIFHATPIARAGDLLFEPFTETIKRIHKLLKHTNDEYLR